MVADAHPHGVGNATSKTATKSDTRITVTWVDDCYGKINSSRMGQVILHLVDVALFVSVGSSITQQCYGCYMDVTTNHK
jgi:hypothetical protein